MCTIRSPVGLPCRNIPVGVVRSTWCGQRGCCVHRVHICGCWMLSKLIVYRDEERLTYLRLSKQTLILVCLVRVGMIMVVPAPAVVFCRPERHDSTGHDSVILTASTCLGSRTSVTRTTKGSSTSKTVLDLMTHDARELKRDGNRRVRKPRQYFVLFESSRKGAKEVLIRGMES